MHPLTGGDDGGGWPFGGAIYSSSLFRVLLAVPGVARLRDNQVEVILDGERQTFCRDVELNRGELIEALAAWLATWPAGALSEWRWLCHTRTIPTGSF